LGSIHIHTQNSSLWQELLQFIVGLLRTRPIITNRTTLTVWTGLRNTLLKTTVVAIHRFCVHVERQGNITVGTLVNTPTITTHDKRRITTPIQHKDDLFLTSQLF